MARSAKRAKPPVVRRGLAAAGMAAIGAMVARNPSGAASLVGLAVAMCYVSANALWYQPHAHHGAFFATRAMLVRVVTAPEPETTIVIERPQNPPPRPASDPVVEQVQSILKDLGFYGGTVDGVGGPATAAAIQNYRRKVGLTASGKIDDDLLNQLGARSTTAGIAPEPAPRPAEIKPAGKAASDATALNRKIQAGLKAFGNDGMEIDGVIGARTRSAIREFQALFGLPETGEPELAVYAKMKEIGLTN